MMRSLLCLYTIIFLWRSFDPLPIGNLTSVKQQHPCQSQVARALLQREPGNRTPDEDRLFTELDQRSQASRLWNLREKVEALSMRFFALLRMTFCCHLERIEKGFLSLFLLKLSSKNPEQRASYKARVTSLN
jgi:hypothetical protein